MAFLTGIELRRRIASGSLEIHSLDPQQPFNVDSQVTEDSIDLRLAPIGLLLKAGIESLDYLSDNLDYAYDVVEIKASGMDLQPMRPFLTQTLEAICFPDELVGLVVTRSTFARLGIMANCLAPKFAAGIRWAFPLQLVNLNSVPVRIYPYAPVAQLMVSETSGESVGYRGKYQDAYAPTAPRIGDRERESLTSANPLAVNRTFHIINRDLRSHAGTDSVPASSAVAAAPQAVAETAGFGEPVTRRSRGLTAAAVSTVCLVAAFTVALTLRVLIGGPLAHAERGAVIAVLAAIAVSAGTTALLWRRARPQERRGGP
ncbi:dCTP deaminase domain-containing protein [Streptomyces sp. NPDC094038]|uniref:dCTP deaminase n=1 Tax=Streptomyces sp. NPDC094038 TaxID=3366055 RepID=UPI00381A84AC